jgi:hypothetical protein
MKRFLLGIAILMVLAGIAGLVWPSFSYHRTREVAKLGPVQATVEEEKVVEIPRPASIIVALAGLALVIVAPRLKN